jgi:hypothetical protein
MFEPFLNKFTKEWPEQGAICAILAESKKSPCNLASILDHVKLFRSKTCFHINCDNKTHIRLDIRQNSKKLYNIHPQITSQ